MYIRGINIFLTTILRNVKIILRSNIKYKSNDIDLDVFA